MWPMETPKRSRDLRAFEVITPAGRIYEFPGPTLLQRVLRLLRSHTDTLAISATIFVLIYVASLAAGALEVSSLSSCDGQGVQRGSLEG